MRKKPTGQRSLALPRENLATLGREEERALALALAELLLAVARSEKRKVSNLVRRGGRDEREGNR